MIKTESETDNMTIQFNPIGTIHTPFKSISGMPIQPAGAKGVKGIVEIKPEYAEGLKDLGGFSHIILIYHFHESKKFTLEVVPFLDSVKRGVFATRAPNRPNPVGLSIVKLLKIESNILHIENVDILDQTPLIDIKPYVPEFDKQSAVKTGWLEKKKGSVILKKSDNRF
jgi:tRNA-Thr(GGU) m(6)t(6)A37 methyltransferase TsaA